MTRGIKISLAVVLLLSMCIMSIGYAQVSNNLQIEGDVSVEPQKNVFLSSAVATNSTFDRVNSYTSTVLNSTVNLEDDGTATINLSFYNNSAYAYKFNRVIQVDYDNTGITYALSNLSVGQEIASYGTLDASITFRYSSGTSTSKLLNSVLNFEFVPLDEYIGDVIADTGIDRFEEILNTALDFDRLIEQMDNYSGNRNNSSYIGNVVGSSSSDSALLNQLFTVDGVNYLKLEIGDKEVPVTAMIKREDVDGNKNNGENGNEMTLYLTSEDPGDLPFWGGSLQVFAAVYTKDTENGLWYMVGQMYEGEASANNYEGGWGRNSFNTDTWKSTATYYGLRTGQTIEALTSNAPKGGVVLSEAEFVQGQTGTINPLESTTVLYSRINLNSADATITIKLLFYNRANSAYVYDGVNIVDGVYSNVNIDYTIEGISIGETIASKATKEATITFRLKDIDNIVTTELYSRINFNFSES